MVDTVTRTDQPTDPKLGDISPRARVWLLAVASVDVLLVVSSMVSLNAALPDIAVETAATQGQLTWIVDGYTLALACLLLPAGALGDRYGRRGALLVGLTIFGLASMAPIVWSSPVALIAARAVAGVGAALIMPATLSLLTSAFPPEGRNKAIGIWAGVAGTSAIFGFLGTGLLLAHFSWQSIFYAFAGWALLMFICTCTIGSSRDETATPIDWMGAGLVGTSIAVFVLGVVEAPVRGWSDALVVACLVVGVVLAALFVLTQLHRRHPLLDVRLFARPDFATGALGITFLFLANFGFFFIEMQFMQLVMGLSPIQTAFALAPLAFPVLALSATVHLYLPKLGLRFAVTGGLLLMAAGLLWMSRLQVDSTYVDMVGPLMLMASGIGLATAPTTSAIMNAAPDEKQGVASAVNDATREIGAALGIAVAGSVLAAAYRSSLQQGLDGYPGPIRDAATESLANAMAVAERTGQAGAGLRDAAQTAFMNASHDALVALSAIILAGAVFVALWSPGRDGGQWTFLRRGKPRATRQSGRA